MSQKPLSGLRQHSLAIAGTEHLLWVGFEVSHRPLCSWNYLAACAEDEYSDIVEWARRDGRCRVHPGWRTECLTGLIPRCGFQSARSGSIGTTLLLAYCDVGHGSTPPTFSDEAVSVLCRLASFVTSSTNCSDTRDSYNCADLGRSRTAPRVDERQ